MVEEIWMLKNRNANIDEISKKYGISKFLSKLIVNRGIVNDDEIEKYINSSYDILNNPKSMKDVEKATEIIYEKIKTGKKIRIIGDYDVDGVISVYCLYKAFTEIGANIDYEIPDRIKDGYGINENIIKLAYEDGVDTIVTCDNGIAAIEQIKYAKKLGLTVIVTDHHDVAFVEENGERRFVLPEADAILNPKQEDCQYPFKKICGAGVAFKLIENLFIRFEKPKEEIYKFLEFVAIATVCDVVELSGENRVFVKEGLKMLNETRNIGLKALRRINELEDKEITTYHLGFVIGPCINASGRLDSAKKGLKLLLSDDESTANQWATEIVELNRTRKEMTQNGVDKSIELIENSDLNKDRILVVYIDDIHESIAGIIAGRIKEKYNKPTIVLTKAENGAKGSARSIEEYNMFEGLNSCRELLNKFGGHPMAAGMSLDVENIDKLREKLNKQCELTDKDLAKKIRIDLFLPVENASIGLVEELSILEPFGTGNSKPIFGAKNVKIVNANLLGKNKNVLRLRLVVGNKSITAMIFNNIEDFESKVKEKYGEAELLNLYLNGSNNVYMDLLFYPNINEWNGNRNIQIIINSIR
ncbi:MAG: single-stranded-DNA-specific exonuclease RecJ [Sarcina sp.]